MEPRVINQMSGSFENMYIEPRMTRGVVTAPSGQGLGKEKEFKEYVVKLKLGRWDKNEETAKLHHLEVLQNALLSGGIRRDIEIVSHTYSSFNCFISEAERRILAGKEEVRSVIPARNDRYYVAEFAMSAELMKSMGGCIMTPENSTPIPFPSIPYSK